MVPALSDAAIRARAHAFELERAIADRIGDGELANVEMPLRHYFADGVYVRAIFMPAGAFVVGKIHKHEHLAIMLSGDISIVDATGAKRMVGPMLPFVSQSGIKRALVIHADTWFLTIHRQRDFDPENEDEIEAAYVASTEEEFRAYIMKEIGCDHVDQQIEVTP